MTNSLIAPAELHDPTVALTAVASAPQPAPVRGIDAWWIRHLRVANRVGSPIDRTILAAVRMDRLAFAVASAHVEAIEQLVPVIGTARIALCQGQPGAAPPIRLTPDGDAWRLFGEAPDVLLGAEADELLVVAWRETATGEQAVMVDLPARRAGIGRQVTVEQPLPRARVRFEGVRASDGHLLEGDGLERYVRRLGPVADAHLHAALAAWLAAFARRADWPPSVTDELLHHVVASRALALADPTRPAVHRALAGEIARLRLLVEECRDLWDRASPADRVRWDEDRPLLDAARAERVARLRASREA